MSLTGLCYGCGCQCVGLTCGSDEHNRHDQHEKRGLYIANKDKSGQNESVFC